MFNILHSKAEGRKKDEDRAEEKKKSKKIKDINKLEEKEKSRQLKFYTCRLSDPAVNYKDETEDIKNNKEKGK